MSEDGLLLALDQGGSTSRALVFDRAGRVAARASVEVGTAHPAPDRVEQDPEDLVRSLRRAVREAVRNLGPRADRMAAAGLATQRSSVVCWDRASGAALSPVLSWQDRRAADRLQPLRAHEAEVRALTGLRLSPHYGATKLAWCLDSLPAVRSAFLHGRLAFGPLASFLAFRLCDERPLVADAANAARTLLYDLGTGDWSPRLLDLFGVPRTALPRCVPTRGEVGTFDTGRRKVPLGVLTGDQSAALFAGGEPRAEVAHATFGTGAFVLRPTETVRNQPGLLTTLVDRTAERTLLALEGTVNGAGSALSWIAEELGLADPTASLPGWLASVRDPPLFLNGVGGLAAPFWVSDFASRFEGEGPPEARVVAVVESVVFLVQTILGGMETALGAPRVVRVGGGLSRLDGLCQRLASLSGVPVERAEQPETTALGVAVLLGATPPAVTLQRFDPRPDEELAARFQRWRARMPA
jgi:glycerol kinase